MNDSRVTASSVRYSAGQVEAQCGECGQWCNGTWERSREHTYYADGLSGAEWVIDVTWLNPGCPHIDLPDMVALVEDYLDANNPRPEGPDPDRFRDDYEGRYDG